MSLIFCNIKLNLNYFPTQDCRKIQRDDPECARWHICSKESSIPLSVLTEGGKDNDVRSLVHKTVRTAGQAAVDGQIATDYTVLVLTNKVR